MKHHCHCSFTKHHNHAGIKRLGVFGVSLMVLHLLYHVAQILILPTVFIGFSHHHDDNTVAVTGDLEETDYFTIGKTAKTAYPLLLSIASNAIDSRLCGLPLL